MRRIGALVAVGALIAGCGSSGSAKQGGTQPATPGSASGTATVSASPSTTTYRVPSASMSPTLPVGSHVVAALDPHYIPSVGDIVLLHPPAGADQSSPVCGNSSQGLGHASACDTPTANESAQVFIKRIVAGPGDSVRIVAGHVIRNGQAETEPFVGSCSEAQICTFRGSIRIPAGDYYVLGDNRVASDDSRFWGPIKRAWIIGKVVKIVR
jgi:signal peptidase I